MNKNDFHDLVGLILCVLSILAMIFCKIPPQKTAVAYHSRADLDTHYIYIEEE